MRTMLDIDEKTLDDVLYFTGETNKSKAVEKALREYLYRAAVQGLIALSGHIEIDDVSKESRKIESHKSGASSW
ncbi:MAG: hypothetical protein FJ318_04095 [SAR202 cluster bacterium]|nr:hypothetical protein [SAR202 cluster bacterium]